MIGDKYKFCFYVLQMDEEMFSRRRQGCINVSLFFFFLVCMNVSFCINVSIAKYSDQQVERLWKSVSLKQYKN